MSALPAGIRVRDVAGINGLTMHVLEAGNPKNPCLLLLHGFPELAYSWRKVMLPLARAGYFVIAPDQRGYGRTTGWDPGYDGDLASFRMLNLARDALGLVAAYGLRSVAAPVRDSTGRVVAGANLAVQSRDWSSQRIVRELRPLVTAACQDISGILGYAG